jgi:hypothetical protein
VKLEGARPRAGAASSSPDARDPIFISQIDESWPSVLAATRAYFKEVPPESYRIIPHLYGKNGVMGELEPARRQGARALHHRRGRGGRRRSLATAICGKARTSLMHAPYPGRIATAGNLASPFTPLEIPLGQACEFNVYHLMKVDSPTALFPIKVEEIADARCRRHCATSPR